MADSSRLHTFRQDNYLSGIISALRTSIFPTLNIERKIGLTAEAQKSLRDAKGEGFLED
jgi:hypothetical protein